MYTLGDVLPSKKGHFCFYVLIFFKWILWKIWIKKKKIYSKILKIAVVFYELRRPSWKNIPHFSALRTPHRNKILSWFKLHLNCIMVFYAISDHFFDILIRKKSYAFSKFWYFAKEEITRFFPQQKNITFFVIKFSKKRSEMAFMAV